MGYFYFRGTKANTIQGPDNSTLYMLQIVGIVLIGCDFSINRFFPTNDTYLFYCENEKRINKLYLVNSIICGIILIISTFLIYANKQRIKKYQSMSQEIKNA